MIGNPQKTNEKAMETESNAESTTPASTSRRERTRPVGEPAGLIERMNNG
jgi:hypothetical protein